MPGRNLKLETKNDINDINYNKTLFPSCFRILLLSLFHLPWRFHSYRPGLSLQKSAHPTDIWYPLSNEACLTWSSEWSDSNICGDQSYHLNRTVSVMPSQGWGWQARQEMHIVAENNSDVHNVTLLFQCLNVHRSNKLTSEAPDSQDTGQNMSYNSHLSLI